MSQPVGVKTIGYTKDGLVFFQVVTVFNNQPLETTFQFKPDNAVGFCDLIMEAVKNARKITEVSN